MLVLERLLWQLADLTEVASAPYSEHPFVVDRWLQRPMNLTFGDVIYPLPHSGELALGVSPPVTKDAMKFLDHQGGAARRENRFSMSNRPYSSGVASHFPGEFVWG
jgi:hypothetical protein